MYFSDHQRNFVQVGLQREVTPQPEPKTFQAGENGEEEEEQAGPQKVSVNVHEGSLSSELLRFLARLSMQRTCANLAAPPPPLRILPPALVDGELPMDFFSAILKSQAYECGWRALLAHAIALHRPLLAILAACYEVSHCVVKCIILWTNHYYSGFICCGVYLCLAVFSPWLLNV